MNYAESILKELIPKDKFDIETAEKLNQYSIDELRPIVPALLEWLQDGNWPVAHPVKLYLEKHVKHIQNEILTVFRTDDTYWKYWVILLLGEGIDDERLINEIKRIALAPTDLEKEDEVDQMAHELIAKKGWG